MASTVTTATIDILTSASTTPGLLSSLSLVVVLALLALLVRMDMQAAAEEEMSSRLSRGLGIAVVPLSFAVAVIAAAQILAVLR